MPIVARDPRPDSASFRRQTTRSIVTGDPMIAQPSGTVTFLFSDIEGSTKLLQELGPERYSAVLARKRELFRMAITHWRGYEVDCEGDGFVVAFRTASDAVEMAAEAQQLLA